MHRDILYYFFPELIFSLFKMEILLKIVSVETYSQIDRRAIWYQIPKDQQSELSRLLPEDIVDSTLYAIFIDSDLDVIETMIPNRANDIYFDDGETEDSLLNIAIQNERADLVDLLLRYGADVNMRVEEYPLDYAVLTGNLQILSTLLYAGADPNLGKIMKNAILSFNLDVIKLLVAHGGLLTEKMVINRHSERVYYFSH